MLTISTTVQVNKISNEFSSFNIPQFYTTVITACDNKVVRELKACNSTLVLVWAM